MSRTPFPAVCVLMSICTQLSAAPVRIAPEGVLLIGGRRVFPIGFTLAPPHDGRTPAGTDALSELKNAGANFLRSGPRDSTWDEAALQTEEMWLDAVAARGMYCWSYLRELSALGPADERKEQLLRSVVERFRGHPGLGVWKNVDEPQWGQTPVAEMVRASRIIRQLDPDHPICTTHAPRGAVEELRPYNASADMLALDIYPIGYPPGAHSLLANKEISMVGDYARFLAEVADGRPRWMVLQIAWSGVVKPGKTLRMPTFAQERFMAYQAIINGARGLFFFGGNLPAAMPPEDAKLGWNWTFWRRVLRPVIEEIGEKSVLGPVLVAPESPLVIRVKGADDVEFCVREVGEDLFILACKREGATVQVEFSGLPAWAGQADVLYESPRTVRADGGTFTDWFAPFEVHVYRFRRLPNTSASRAE